MDRKIAFLVIYLLMRTQGSGELLMRTQGSGQDSIVNLTDDNIDKKDLVLVPTGHKEEKLDEDNVGETSFKHESDYDVFQATNQWQTVKKGQAIPPGLHVQIDLQTGQKRAKLMDEASGKKDEVKEDSVTQLPKQKYIKIDNNFISKQRLKDALKDFKDKFQNEDLVEEEISAHAKNKYRSMDELKQELEGAEIWMKKDIEIIQELVEKLNNSKSTKAEIIKALEELEYFVHQIDNARDLSIIGGLALVVNFLNQSDEDIQSHAAYVVGAAAQSNIPVQLHLLELGALPLLMRLLANEDHSIRTRKKAMYALSCLLRLFPRGTKQFLKIGGLSVMASLFQEHANDPLKIKGLTLLVDLLMEQMDSIRKKAKEMGIQDYEKAVIKAPLLNAMYQEGWCSLATSLAPSADNETREKLLQAFQVLLPACRRHFKNSNLEHSLKIWKQEWLEEIERDELDDSGYLESLVKLVDGFVGKLR